MFELTHAILSSSNKVIPVANILTWARWWEKADRQVGRDTILGIQVSTVFLGINHGWGEKELWFETMIFAPSYLKVNTVFRDPYMMVEEFYCERYATWEEAKIGHAQAVAWLKERLSLSVKYQLQLTDKENE